MNRDVQTSVFTLVLVVGALIVSSSHLLARAMTLQPSNSRSDTFVSRKAWDSCIGSRVGFRLYIDFGTRSTGRIIRQPGSYQLTATQTDRVPDPGLRVAIKEIPRSEWLQNRPKDESYSTITSAAAASGSLTEGSRVSFEATFRRLRRTADKGLEFQTRRGATCVIEDRGGYAAQLMRAAADGHKILIKGVVRSLSEISVDDCEFLPSSSVSPLRNRIWEVRVSPPGGTPRVIHRPGLYYFTLPVDGRELTLRAHLQEIKLSRLTVGGYELTAEVADTPPARYYGLQGRSHLPPDRAMLFVFERPATPEFVMKSVTFPISIGFFTADGRLTNAEKMNPGDQTPARPTEPIRYVIETRQGWFEKHGAGPGSRMQFQRSKNP